MPDRSWALHLPARHTSCRRARLALQRFLTALVPEPVAQDALLVLHELVANGVDHARTPMRLTADVHDGAVRVAVRDGSATPGREQPLDPSAARGRGLQIVSAVSRRWGVRRHAAGKTTWAEIGPPTAAPRPEFHPVGAV
ncbi:ATP-binding protein [Pseudonocardia parietis]|uniref:Two-component sensor histidine kinase n=1 Tax=Pseudonocardia parietis TaxID=570936 RepID=A0ABS4VT08_9PSEU|nr:ATP-binding protein [Pseudonocardia parietis]MBP2367051.1 two-component sensor histidine kinase [Pseudonocardia parietis]